MTHLQLLLRCNCGERWEVSADNYSDYKFWSLMARVEYANHVTMENVGKIMGRVGKYDKSEY